MVTLNALPLQFFPLPADTHVSDQGVSTFHLLNR
jgi:hypothetical protein